MDSRPEAATLRDLLTEIVSGAASPKVGAHAELLGDGCPRSFRGCCPRDQATCRRTLLRNPRVDRHA
jgi:hypothetical protein